MTHTITIASDHAGYELKQHLIAFLQQRGVAVNDLGPANADSVDYPDFAQKAARAVLENSERAPGQSMGILVCGSGIGISIAANRFKGIRCALCTSVPMAEMARKHNNANMLALGARLTTPAEAENILAAFLDTEFEGGRHENRILKIDNPARQG